MSLLLVWKGSVKYSRNIMICIRTINFWAFNMAVYILDRFDQTREIIRWEIIFALFCVLLSHRGWFFALFLKKESKIRLAKTQINKDVMSIREFAPVTQSTRIRFPAGRGKNESRQINLVKIPADADFEVFWSATQHWENFCCLLYASHQMRRRKKMMFWFTSVQT